MLGAGYIKLWRSLLKWEWYGDRHRLSLDVRRQLELSLSNHIPRPLVALDLDMFARSGNHTDTSMFDFQRAYI